MVEKYILVLFAVRDLDVSFEVNFEAYGCGPRQCGFFHWDYLRDCPSSGGLVVRPGDENQSRAAPFYHSINAHGVQSSLVNFCQEVNAFPEPGRYLVECRNNPLILSIIKAD